MSSFSLASRAIACKSGIFSSAALSTTTTAAGRKCASKKSFSVKVVRAQAASEDGENDVSADVDAKTNAGEESETSSTTSITTIEKTKDMGSEDEYELVGPKPERFKVAEGQLVSLLTAATPASTRLISGVLTSGWKVSLETGPVPDGEYSFGSFGGRYLKETSDTESFKRPEKPLKLYEFEGCPFCRKAREAIAWLDLDPIVYPCPQGGKDIASLSRKLEGKRSSPT